MNKVSRITIGLVTYDRLDMLKEAVHSVLQQTYNDYCLLIGNDCPEVPVTYKSLGIAPDQRIKIINHEENLGEVNNLNALLKISNSEWFTWLCDDDLFHPDFLSNMMGVIENQTDTSTVAVYTNYISSSKFLDSFYKPLPSQEPQTYSPADFTKDYVNRTIKLVGCYGLMRTAALKNISGMPILGNSFGPYSDTIIPILLARYGNLAWIDSFLVLIRTHTESQSAVSINFEAFSSAEVDFLTHLEQVCSIENIGLKPKECFFPMVRWFADNELNVLSRTTSQNKLSVSLTFLRYQFAVNFPRLEKKYWAKFSVYIIRKLAVLHLTYLRNLLR